jgi:N-acyl-D-amino-acid deacylase
MFTRPRGPAGYEQDGSPRDAYYAMGWMVRPQVDELGHRTEGLPGHANHWHNGLLPGTASLLVRRHDGLTWAIVANRGYGPEGETVVEDIDPALHRAADAIREWL